MSFDPEYASSPLAQEQPQRHIGYAILRWIAKPATHFRHPAVMGTAAPQPWPSCTSMIFTPLGAGGSSGTKKSGNSASPGWTEN